MSDPVKRAAQLLKEGATMLPETCPICGSPLYKLKDGTIVCPIHGEIRRIKSAVEQKGKKELNVNEVLKEVTEVALEKLSKLSSKAYTGGKEEAEEMLLWLKVLEKAVKLKGE
ncbi:Sjogren's syndrome/scleroderma autoantigen 1 family protein [Ignicoccus hospitalis]|uniref:Sjogrens syndrome scleroderma autoantigen 1 n=1 Tax=Ignicoccus hospitalis (strain KIN4/I / DSM 18386 / JCM 14125) TaxID=453591 RepID=A8ABT0_IGNH4|nr:Sjogren's syndrome/scleroderma autoantigen 1 family protein [Ignicoccus hospitalis]ABU82382.1 Sjogrens syndrome scleroderma autoantigen 1 [Ignicoccus hospitalis KIN4/I]HIH90857.1 hypothetical protein [Desulfurococcaceae archaeon]